MSLRGQLPTGNGHNLVTELDLRSVIVHGLHELSQDEEGMANVVSRVDMLRYGSQERWKREMRQAIIDLLDPEGDRYVTVGVGFPTPDAHLPFVSVVKESGGENDAEAMLGDMLDDCVPDIVGEWVGEPALDNGMRLTPLPEGSNTDWSPSVVHVEYVQPIGIGYQATIECGVWSVAPEESILLHSMVWWALFRGKGQLSDSGVHEVRLQDSGFTPDERMDPRAGYVPTIRATLLSTYSQVRRTQATQGAVIKRTNIFTV